MNQEELDARMAAFEQRMALRHAEEERKDAERAERDRQAYLQRREEAARRTSTHNKF